MTVGPAGIEPTTSTVESGRLAPITQLFGERPSEEASGDEDDPDSDAPAPLQLFTLGAGA